MRLLTLLPEEQVAAIEAAHSAAPEAKGAQIALADEVTRLVRGPEAVAAAHRCAAALFGSKAAWSHNSGATGPSGAATLRADDILSLIECGQVPSAALTPAEAFSGGLEVAEAAVRCGATKSKAEARRQIAAKGLYLNHVRLEDQRQKLSAGDFIEGRVALLASGKKKMWALTVVEAPA